MERARHRKTKSASGIEGIQQIQKQKTVPRLSSDSHSYIDGSNRDDMFVLEMGQSTLGRTGGVPMKKLLAEEMSKDVEHKRRSPNVIARLMGFEGLPSPRHVHRQQKKIPENYQQKNVSINDQRNDQLYDRRSIQRSSIDQQEFKDVYEDLEASHVVNRRCSSRWNAKSILTKPEMELIQQKFMDAKRLSSDEKLQSSKELDDTLEMLDSNKDLLLKLFGQSDSLFVKHLRDLQVDAGNSLGSHIAVLKPSNLEKFESKSKAWRSEGGTSKKSHVTSHLKREDGLLLERHSRHRAYISRNSSKIQLEEVSDEKSLPTRIVVLKPNLGKMQSSGTSISSPDSQGYLPRFKKTKEYPSVGRAETGSWRRKESSHSAGLSKAMSNEAREIARKITMRMRDGYDEIMDAKSIAYRGYVGDESSYDANESDSDSEAEVLRLSSRRSFDDSNNCRYPSRFGESPVNMEAKKRLSERWKMTHKYQDLEMISRGSTLGEMLACPDKEIRPHQLNAQMSPSRASKGHGSNNGNAILEFPLGISSRDGWIDEMSRNSARLRSLPPPTGGRGRNYRRRSPNHDKWAEDKNAIHSDSAYCGKSKVVKGKHSHGENYSAKDSKSRSKTFHPHQRIFANEMNSSSGTNFEIQMEPNTKDLSERHSLFSTSEKTDSSEFPVVDVVMNSEHGSTTVSSESSEVFVEQPLSTIASDKVANHKQEGCQVQELLKESSEQGSPHMQCLGAEPESSESSKEADHPSPISVLEVPCNEETSSSESFERVSAELHELRMQLKLLKMESGSYSETSSLHPIEEEESHLSPNKYVGNHMITADSWRTSYALDVLANSGLEETNFNNFRTLWHSSNHPLDPTLFDKLEKKYNDEGRWDRRLVFDQTNSALLEIFEEHANLWPWVKPKLAGSHLQWEGVQEAVKRLVEEEQGGREMSERVLDREMLWSNSKGEIDIIGNEMEKLLIDDLITEVICN